MTKTFPVILGTAAGNIAQNELREAGIAETDFKICLSLRDILEHLESPDEVTPQRRLVLVDTSSDYGITRHALAEAGIRGTNPHSEIIHFKGWDDARKHFVTIKEFLNELATA